MKNYFYLSTCHLRFGEKQNCENLDKYILYLPILIAIIGIKGTV